MVSVRQADSSDVGIVAELVHALLAELTPPDAELPKVEDIRASTAALMGDTCRIWAFLAFNDDNQANGVLTLNECAAIYAGGQFGEICEFYVAPKARSQRVGPALLDSAKAFAREKGWVRLEVGAPDVPRWNRTVSFYLNNGFVEVGPRLKLPLG